jgi:hypothetical protein
MKESLKEKRIRFVLIGFFILLTSIGFLYRFEMSEKEDKHYSPLATVLKSSENGSDNPVIALYEYKNSKHILAAYEIERMNKYKFKTIHAIEMKEAPDQLVADQITKGVWAKTDGNWNYYSQNLQEENRTAEHRMPDSALESSFSFDQKKSKVYLNTNHSISLENGEKPTGLFSLTSDGSVWLVLTERNIKIAAIDTK